jgi:hypothetical protein
VINHEDLAKSVRRDPPQLRLWPNARSEEVSSFLREMLQLERKLDEILDLKDALDLRRGMPQVELLPNANSISPRNSASE